MPHDEAMVAGGVMLPVTSQFSTRWERRRALSSLHCFSEGNEQKEKNSRIFDLHNCALLL
jgi:hypothetical protein